MLTTKDAKVMLVDLKSFIMSGTPGANIEDPNGVNIVRTAMIIMFVHFFLAGQFKGLAGSSGPSQSTRFGSLVGVFVILLVACFSGSVGRPSRVSLLEILLKSFLGDTGLEIGGIAFSVVPTLDKVANIDFSSSTCGVDNSPSSRAFRGGLVAMMYCSISEGNSS